MPKILLVEDNKDLTTLINVSLKQDYAIDIVHNGGEGLECLRTGRYDVVILDWELPELSGPEICRQFRASGGTTPVLMLTGKSHIAEKEQGLDAGADDYLTKPFDMRELAARLRALARRPAARPSAALTFLDLHIDPVRHSLKKGDEEIHLLKKDFALLEFLMRYPEEIFGTETILERVWSYDSEVTADAVRTSIKRIRKALDQSADESESIIENVRRVGYRLRRPAK